MEQWPQGVPGKSMKVEIPVPGPGKDGYAVKGNQFLLESLRFFKGEIVVLEFGQAHPDGTKILVKVLKSRDGLFISLFDKVFILLPGDGYRKHIGSKYQSFHGRKI
jgi:hypothetical protein